jgi:hypothetical protein
LLSSSSQIKVNKKGGILLTEGTNEVMRKRITKWGLPECIRENKDNVIFKFDDISLENTNEQGYHCQDGDVKFCLIDKRNAKVLFSMDFYKNNSKISNLSRKPVGIKLELLYVHDESLRKKGVASFYIKKLIDYAIHEQAECIYVQPNANARNFKNDGKKNSLRQRELEDFYKKRSTQEMPIRFL